MRAGLTPNAVQWCRCGGLRGRNLAESVAVRRRFRAGVGVFCQTLVTDKLDKEHEGISEGQPPRCLLIGTCCVLRVRVQEPYERRRSRAVLREARGAVPRADSTHFERSRCAARQHHPESAGDLPAARGRCLRLPGRCAPANQRASGQPGHRTHPADVEIAIRRHADAFRPPSAPPRFAITLNAVPQPRPILPAYRSTALE